MFRFKLTSQEKQRLQHRRRQPSNPKDQALAQESVPSTSLLSNSGPHSKKSAPPHIHTKSQVPGSKDTEHKFDTNSLPSSPAPQKRTRNGAATKAPTSAMDFALNDFRSIMASRPVHLKPVQRESRKQKRVRSQENNKEGCETKEKRIKAENLRGGKDKDDITSVAVFIRDSSEPESARPKQPTGGNMQNEPLGEMAPDTSILEERDTGSQIVSLRDLKVELTKQLDLEDDILNLPRLKDQLKDVVVSMIGAPPVERKVFMKLRLELIQTISTAEKVLKKRQEDAMRIRIPRQADPAPPEPKEKVEPQYKPTRSKRISGPVRPKNPKAKLPPLEYGDWDTELTPHQLKKMEKVKGKLNDDEKKLVAAGLVVWPENADEVKKKENSRTVIKKLVGNKDSMFDNPWRRAAISEEAGEN